MAGLDGTVQTRETCKAKDDYKVCPAKLVCHKSAANMHSHCGWGWLLKSSQIVSRENRVIFLLKMALYNKQGHFYMPSFFPNEKWDTHTHTHSACNE